jgi:hypothetical protein
MVSTSTRIEALSHLGEFLRQELGNVDNYESTFAYDISSRAQTANGWFVERESKKAISYWANTLTQENLENWMSSYPAPEIDSVNVGLVLAGNIPMVGFHDVLATILSGNRAMIKCASVDNVLIPALLGKLVEFEKSMNETYALVDRLEGFEAVLATGSNNSSRYFESYFSHVPNVIRKNRTGIAILDGTESEAELQLLMKDCFQYFGLGCRNVTKLFLPKDYDVNNIFKASMTYGHLMDNSKYVNNYTYHKALMMLEKKPVLENDLILMIEEPSLFSPVSVLNYEFYENKADLSVKVERNLEQIQCVIGHGHRDFGSGQSPELNDYADGIDTLDFLNKLTPEKLPN